MSMYQSDAELRDSNNYWHGYQTGFSKGQRQEFEEAANIIEGVLRALMREEDLKADLPAVTAAFKYIDKTWGVNT